MLKEQEVNELYKELPCIWLKPVLKKNIDKKNAYICPLYKTSTRAGVLSTTGHSTNFVMYINLKTDQDPSHWTRRGAALITQLDN